MFYAHEGSSNDNAFTTMNGFPTRIFLAFKTKKERLDAQIKIYNESNHCTNLIFCDRKLVEKYYGKKFAIVEGVIYSQYEYETQDIL